MKVLRLLIVYFVGTLAGAMTFYALWKLTTWWDGSGPVTAQLDIPDEAVAAAFGLFTLVLQYTTVLPMLDLLQRRNLSLKGSLLWLGIVMVIVMTFAFTPDQPGESAIAPGQLKQMAIALTIFGSAYTTNFYLLYRLLPGRDSSR